MEPTDEEKNALAQGHQEPRKLVKLDSLRLPSKLLTLATGKQIKKSEYRYTWVKDPVSQYCYAL